jgi:NitT/TauT family transport system permease protein
MKFVMKIINKKGVLPIFAALGFILFWQIAVSVFSVPKYMLPGPYEVLYEIFVDSPVSLIKHSLITLYEAVLGFMLAVIVAVPFSVAVVWWRPVEKTLLPLMIFIKTVPKVAIAPLFIIWFGFGPFPKVIISFMIAYFPLVIEMIAGLRAVEPTVIRLLRSMSASKFQIFTKARIPNSMPHFFSGIKLASLFCLVGAIVGEFMGSQDGLGYLVLYAMARFDTTLAFAVITVFMFLGRALFYFAELAERYTISWHVVMRTKEDKKVAFTA